MAVIVCAHSSVDSLSDGSVSLIRSHCRCRTHCPGMAVPFFGATASAESFLNGALAYLVMAHVVMAYRAMASAESLPNDALAHGPARYPYDCLNAMSVRVSKYSV